MSSYAYKCHGPNIGSVMDTEGHFTGRALLIFVTAADAAYIQRRHLFKPFLYDGVPLILTRSQAPRVSRRTSPTRVVMVHDAPKSTSKNDLWRIMADHGKVEWISRWYLSAPCQMLTDTLQARREQDPMLSSFMISRPLCALLRLIASSRITLRGNH